MRWLSAQPLSTVLTLLIAKQTSNMKKYVILSVIFLLLAGSAGLSAQEAGNISQEFKTNSIASLNKLMIDRYVFPDVAEKTASHLTKQLEAGVFDACNDVKSFSEALTREVQSVNHDKHMRIRPAPDRQAPPDSPEWMVENWLNELDFMRQRGTGFAEAKKMEGNTGYLDLRGFAPPQMGGPAADSYMQLLSTSDAIIIDLRKNGGGSPEMVRYLCSYFFDKKVHLNSLYWRENDRTEEFWTQDVKGKKLPDVPLFILTSNYTFSGAEEFSYNMQTQKRATLIGETTGGGANPGGGMPINEKMMVFIPTGRAINPITGTNWEGVGVVPEVKVPAGEALDKATEMAKEAAEKYRAQQKDKNKAMLTAVVESIAAPEASFSGDAVYQNLKKCHEAGLLGEMEINMIGYEQLGKNKPQAAEAVFAANTRLFPESANVYDSYGESLAANGKLEDSVAQYRKAVKLAKANGDPNLGMFTENLKKMETKLKNKP